MACLELMTKFCIEADFSMLERYSTICSIFVQRRVKPLPGSQIQDFGDKAGTHHRRMDRFLH
jgi:hypothetical protein